jgi:hypothetical protein
MRKHSRRRNQRSLSMASPDVVREVDYIVSRAALFDGRVVTLGQLVYFSTDSGDAWMLDPQDHFALRLADAGDRLPVHVVETATSFDVGWTASYRLEGEVFVVADASGARAIVGYPIRELRRAEHMILSTQMA